MSAQKLTERFQALIELAVLFARKTESDALMLLIEGPIDWRRLRELADGVKFLIAADFAPQVEGAADFGFATVLLKMPGAPVYEKLTQALLEAVADDILASGRAGGQCL